MPLHKYLVLASDWKFSPKCTWLLDCFISGPLLTMLINGWNIFFLVKFKFIVFLGLNSTTHCLDHLSSLSILLVRELAVPTIPWSTKKK